MHPCQKERPGLAGMEAFFVIDQNRSSANWPLAKTLQRHDDAETGFKPTLGVSRDAEGLAKGQFAELRFWNSINYFPYYTSQTAKTFSSSTAISFVDAHEGSFPIQSRLRRNFARCTPPHRSFPIENRREARGGKSKRKLDFLRYWTPPDFCIFDVTRRVVNDVSHWPKIGGVLRGSGRVGSRV